jgi:hypothetical protein
MSIFLIGFILIGGVGFFGYQFVLSPLKANGDQITRLTEENELREARIARIMKRRADEEKWKKLSLPPDPINPAKPAEQVSMAPGRSPADNARADLAQREYEREINEMLRAAGYAAADVAIIPKKPDAKSAPQYPTKKPIYTKLIFTVQLKGDLASLVDFMGRFYKLRLLHQIRNMTVQKPVGSEIRTAAPGGSPGNSTPSTDLDVTLTIEALVLDNAEQRKTLLPDKAVDVPSVLARSESQYAMIAGKNLFYGPSLSTGRETRSISIDTAPFVRLNGIVSGENGLEATLWDTYHNWDYKITPRSLGGYNVEAQYTLGGRKRADRDRSGKTLALRDTEGNVTAEWQIARIDPREIILRGEGGKFYAVHMGDYLAQRRDLSKSDLDTLGIKAEQFKDLKASGNELDDP